MFIGMINEQNYDELKAACNGGNFIDELFPPWPGAIVMMGDENVLKSYGYDKFEWKSIADVRGDNHKLFDGISPTDIAQGDLGNCYLMACLAELAIRPERIMKMFKETEVTKERIYCIKMYKNGLPVNVIVDDYIPWVKPRSTVPLPDDPNADKWTEAFSRGKEGECWVQLIEKAYAKLHCCYRKLNRGDASSCMRDLTGAPGFHCVTEYNQNLFEDIKEARSNKYPCFGDCTGSKQYSVDDIKQTGLVPGHEYCILQAKTVEVNGESHNLLNLYNPWGKTEWNGDWSDDSDKWTPELKEELKVESKNEGSFWIACDEFKKYFPAYTVVKLHDDFILNTATTKGRTSVHLFKVDTPGPYWFSV